MRHSHFARFMTFGLACLTASHVLAQQQPAAPAAGQPAAQTQSAERVLDSFRPIHTDVEIETPEAAEIGRAHV